MQRFNARLKDDNHVKIFIEDEEINSNISFYLIPSISNPIEYSPDIKLENDEWFYVVINEEQKTEMISKYLVSIKNSGELNKITKEDYENIDILYLVNDQNKIIFTKIIKSYYVRTTKILDFDTDLGPQIKEQDNSVTFTGIVDLYFDGNDKLYFRSYGKAKSVLKGLVDFYKIATAEEKNDFLSNDFLKTTKDISHLNIGERNLRKISYLIKERNIDLSNQEIRGKYLDYARQYIELDIKISANGELEFENNKDISNILNLLEEHFYTTPITGEKREINSSKKIGE